jgi:high affinity Mn2+ porin
VASERGVFLRVSRAGRDGTKEAYHFTEIDRSLSAGLSLGGSFWRRPDDTIGLDGALSQLLKSARSYFAAGGLGILIGDGQLPHYAPEQIFEVSYRLRVLRGVAWGLDYQYIRHPGTTAIGVPAPW